MGGLVHEVNASFVLSCRSGTNLRQMRRNGNAGGCAGRKKVLKNPRFEEARLQEMV
jgi:hypothetical protein